MHIASHAGFSLSTYDHWAGFTGRTVTHTPTGTSWSIVRQPSSREGSLVWMPDRFEVCRFKSNDDSDVITVHASEAEVWLAILSDVSLLSLKV